MWTTLALLAACAADPTTDRVGSRIDRLDHLPRGRSATVVVFLSFDCPVANAYAETLNALAGRYTGAGVAFVGLVPAAIADDELARHVRDFAYTFPVRRDNRLAAADALKATVTPEAFLLDRHGVLRYRGRIDDTFAARLRKNSQTTRHDLRDAIDAVLADRPVGEPATSAIGCPISRERPRVADGAVTYHRDVLPILQTHCQGCHRPGEVGPFSLLTYEQALNWADDIREYTQTKRMPPWKPAPGGLPFAHERALPDADIAALARWVEAGCPEGDPGHAPPPAAFTDGWQLGPPDLVLTVPEPMTIGPSGNDLFRVFVLPTGLTEDKYVTAFEVRPGNRRVVHHTLNFVDTTGAARQIAEREQNRPKSDEEVDRGPGYSVRMGIGIVPRGAIGGWAPGYVPRYLPDGVGYFLPKNSDLVMQVHYHRTGKTETDQTSIGLYFAKTPAREILHALPVGVANPIELLAFRIPPGRDRYVARRSLWLAEDTTMYSVMPHMHLVGRSITLTMTPPGGEPVTLVDIPEWEYNWQETYFFRDPVRLKAGTRFDLTAVYDNSDGNPNNPFSPPRPIRFGEQTTDEMMFGFVGVTGPSQLPVRFSLDAEMKSVFPPRRPPPKPDAPGQ